MSLLKQLLINLKYTQTNMTFRAFTLLIRKQIRSKFGRLLLASGGIVIAVWAITLSNGLSLSLNQAIVTAINSQPLAKEIQVNKPKDGKLNFGEAPTLVAIGWEEFDQISKLKGVQTVSPRERLTIFVKNQTNQNYACNQQAEALAQTKLENLNFNQTATNPPQATIDIEQKQQEFEQNCKSVTTFANTFQNFYETHKNHWLGQTKAPARGEIVVCFECGSLSFNKYLGVDKPEDMLGKTIYLELAVAPISLQAGDQVNVLGFNNLARNKITKTQSIPMTIVSVIDDRENSNFSLTGGANNNFFLDFSYYLEALQLGNPTVDLKKVGFLEVIVFLEDYSSLDQVLTTLKEKGYFAVSIAKILIDSIDTVLTILRVVLFGFGVIILIASLFGIVAIMTISVLERRKEIGILKAMGATDGSIFLLFLAESIFLGLFGWVLGTLAFYASSWLIQQAFAKFVFSNAEWKANLANFNLYDFYPVAPWWLLVSTLTVAVFFTTLSGIYPALKAARQNPVEVLRTE